jgi:hypothetical protein
MTREISESDWKVFRQLRTVALNRYCERALADFVALAADGREGAHKRYQELFDLMQRRDKELVATFDFLRRSTAVTQLIAIRFRRLLTDEEFARFSPELRDLVNTILSG